MLRISRLLLALLALGLLCGPGDVVAQPEVDPDVEEEGDDWDEDEDGDDEDTAIPSLWNFLFSAAAETSKGETLLPFDAFSLGGAGVKLKLPASLSGIMLSADEHSAIRCLLENNDMEFPPSFWE